MAGEVQRRMWGALGPFGVRPATWDVAAGLVVAVVVAAMSIGAMFWWHARAQDGLAAAAARQVVVGAIGSRTEVLTNLVQDYAVWDEAFQRTGGTVDVEWADDNLRSWAFRTGEVDLSLVIDALGRVTYAAESGRRAEFMMGLPLPSELQPLLDELRSDPAGEPKSALVRIDSGPAIALAAPIGTPGSDSHGRSVLVFVDPLDHQLLDRWARHFGLAGLHWRTRPELDGPGQLTLYGPGGVELGTLAWELDLPGQALLRQVLPGMTLALAGLAVMALLAAHRSRTTVRLLHRTRIQVTHDHLTGLPNRILLEQRIDSAVARGLRQGHGVAVLYLDLDGFKHVNDSLGHEGGDLLLGQVAQRLRSLVREVDTVARISGDEFAVVQSMVETPAAATRLCNRLVRALAEPFFVCGSAIRIGVSIGVALAPRDGREPAQLLRFADRALYRAKASGRGTFRLSEPDGTGRAGQLPVASSPLLGH